MDAGKGLGRRASRGSVTWDWLEIQELRPLSWAAESESAFSKLLRAFPYKAKFWEACDYQGEGRGVRERGGNGTASPGPRVCSQKHLLYPGSQARRGPLPCHPRQARVRSSLVGTVSVGWLPPRGKHLKLELCWV